MRRHLPAGMVWIVQSQLKPRIFIQSLQTMGAYLVSQLVAIGTFSLPILQSQNQHIQSIDQDNGKHHIHTTDFVENKKLIATTMMCMVINIQCIILTAWNWQRNIIMFKWSMIVKYREERK